MKRFRNKFHSMRIINGLMELVKLECMMKKHFIYITHINEMKHKKFVIKQFDKAIRKIGILMTKIRNFRNKLNK